MPISIPMQVRLTLDHMRAEIVHAFAGLDLATDVDAAVRRAVDQFDFQKEVADILRQELLGIVRDGVRRELQSLAWMDKRFREELAGIVTRALRRGKRA